MHGFVFSRDAAQLPRIDHRIGDWGLAVANHLPVTRVMTEDGTVIGLILGWAIDPRERRMLGTEWRIAIGARTMEEFHTQEIRPLAGTYLAILSFGDDTRIYLDGLGNLSLVFDPEREVAAGTAACFMDDTEYASRFDQELYSALELRREGWFPAGLTAHKGLERLMPNHYLDCSIWEQVRFTSYVQATFANPTECLAVIAEEIALCLEAPLAAGLPVTVGLTGGGDSRLLLAGSKAFVEYLGFYTVAAPGNSPRSFDVIRAAELAQRFGLKHTTLAYVTASDAEAQAWDRRVSDCVITNNRRQHPSVYPLENDICIGGLGGEVGRCFLWPDIGRIPAITATAIVDLLKLPRVPRLIERIEAWLDRVPPNEPSRLLDLAYLELRMGSQGNVQSYANPRSTIIHPLSSFTAMEAMLKMPPDFRQNDGLVTGFVEEYWPELLDLPINRYGDYRDFLKPLQKAANPVKVFRKARQVARVYMKP